MAVHLGPQHGLWAQNVVWQEVGTSMVVEPRVLGNGTILVRLTPRFDYRAGGDAQTVDVTELSTEVIVRAGEEISLGGVPFRDTDFRERFLAGVDESGQTARVEMTPARDASSREPATIRGSLPMKYRLVHLTGGLAGRVRDVDMDELVLGRDPQAAQVVFPADDGTVSRRHALLRVEDGRLLLRDLDSSTGTFVDGHDVEEAELADGDVFALGADGPRLRVELAEGGTLVLDPAPRARAAGEPASALPRRSPSPWAPTAGCASRS